VVSRGDLLRHLQVKAPSRGLSVKQAGMFLRVSNQSIHRLIKNQLIRTEPTNSNLISSKSILRFARTHTALNHRLGQRRKTRAAKGFLRKTKTEYLSLRGRYANVHKIVVKRKALPTIARGIHTRRTRSSFISAFCRTADSTYTD